MKSSTRDRRASNEDVEPDLDLIDPRAVSRRVNRADLVRGILQEFAARLLGLEDSGLALNTVGFLHPAVSANQLDECCRAVGVKLVGDEYPTGVGVTDDSRLDMRAEICLGSCRPEGRIDKFAGGDREVGDQTQGAVPAVLELDAIDQARRLLHTHAEREWDRWKRHITRAVGELDRPISYLACQSVSVSSLALRRARQMPLKGRDPMRCRDWSDS